METKKFRIEQREGMNMENAGKKLLLGSIVLLSILAVGILIGVLLHINNNQTGDYGDIATTTNHYEESLLEDLQTTLDFMLGRATRGYIWGEFRLPHSQATFERLIADEELSDRVNQLITYDITNIQINSDDLTATALIRMNFPDVYGVMTRVADGLGDRGTIEELMNQTRQVVILGNHEMIEEVISVDLRRSGVRWYLVRNEQIYNVLSGNVAQAYWQIIDETILDFLEDGSND